MNARAGSTQRLADVRRSEAQTRVIAAALGLFADHGVNGTSLQMIADALGVTKAAIYHQFKTKDEIVVAAVEVELVKLEVALDAADAEPDPQRARELVLAQVIDSAVAQRGMVGVVQHDPVIVRHLARHRPFRDLMHRLYAVLTGGAVTVDARVPRCDGVGRDRRRGHAPAGGGRRRRDAADRVAASDAGPARRVGVIRDRTSARIAPHGCAPRVGSGGSSRGRQAVVTGRDSQPRTVEVRACTAWSQSTSHSGKRISTSSSATRPSRRASAAPRQKWMP